MWPMKVFTTGLIDIYSAVVRLAISKGELDSFLTSMTQTLLSLEPVAIKFGFNFDQLTVLMSSLCTFKSLDTGWCSWIFYCLSELIAGASLAPVVLFV